MDEKIPFYANFSMNIAYEYFHIINDVLIFD